MTLSARLRAAPAALAVTCAAALAALSPAVTAPAAAQTVTPYSLEILAEGLDRPWGLAPLPGSDGWLITGRGGQLWHWTPASGPVALSGLPRVDDRGQGGLLDLALDPGFADNGRVWLVWTGAVGRGASTHLGHGRLDLQSRRLADMQTVFVAQPAIQSPAHFGARIVIHDGHLFLGLGDRSQKDFGPDHVSQRLDTENGAVVRLTLDGQVPADNPFAGRPGAAPAIWSYGHRNIQAMAIQPETGRLWVAEHGENGGDEINIVEPGGNYGWPLAAHGTTYRGGQTFAPPHRPGDGFIAPVWHSPAGRAAPFPPSGMVFYTGAAFDGWQGDMLLGNLGQRFLGRFTLQSDTPVLTERLLDGRDWRIRDVAQGADGLVYVLTDGEDGRLIRLAPESPR